MIIKNITLTKDKKNTTISADVIFKNGNSHNMFFRLNKSYDKFLAPDATAFLASLLLPAMKTGENIHIEGSVSERVLKNIPKIMELIKKWNIGLSEIKVTTDSRSKIYLKPAFVGCFFTRGVDSFYTYLKNKKYITHFITIHGCDIALKNKLFFSQIMCSIREIAYKENKKIIIVESNYREIIEPVLEWEWNLGSALAAVGLLLNSGLKKVYIPAGMKKNHLYPYGTHPDLDPLWSTNKLKIIHDGCEYGRLEKVVRFIAKSSLALKYLRVCCHTLKSKYNCSECFKCMQTKIELYCAGVLDKAETFDKNLNTDLVRKIHYNYALNFNIYAEEAVAFLKKNKRDPRLHDAIIESLRQSKYPSFLRRVTNLMAYLDKKYNERRIYTQICSITPDHDRTLLFKIITKLGLYT